MLNHYPPTISPQLQGFYRLKGYCKPGILLQCFIFCILSFTVNAQDWQKTYGGISDDFGNDVEQTIDGGYIVTGSYYNLSRSRQELYLIKTNGVGDTIWTKSFGGLLNETGISVKQTADNGFIV